MNDKVVSLETAKLLKEAGWEKETELYWYWWGWYDKKKVPEWELIGKGNDDLDDNDYFAPDLLDLTKEIRDIFNNRQPTISDAILTSPFEKFKRILSQKNEVDVAAEIWIALKKEGL